MKTNSEVRVFYRLTIFDLPWTNYPFFLHLPKRTMAVKIAAIIRKGKYIIPRSVRALLIHPFPLATYPAGQAPWHTPSTRTSPELHVRQFVTFELSHLKQPA